jgi:hypothetical protein
MTNPAEHSHIYLSIYCGCLLVMRSTKDHGGGRAC